LLLDEQGRLLSFERGYAVGKLGAYYILQTLVRRTNVMVGGQLSGEATNRRLQVHGWLDVSALLLECQPETPRASQPCRFVRPKESAAVSMRADGRIKGEGVRVRAAEAQAEDNWEGKCGLDTNSRKLLSGACRILVLMVAPRCRDMGQDPAMPQAHLPWSVLEPNAEWSSKAEPPRSTKQAPLPLPSTAAVDAKQLFQLTYLLLLIS
jgi:hypothetical protein